MALTPEKLARINATYKRAAAQSQQGLDFKAKAGSYEVRIQEIPGAGDYVFQEYYEHQHPGQKKGFGTCGLSLGRERCFHCEIINALAPLAEGDDVLSDYLAQMSTGDRPKYAFKVLIRELDSPTWLGPVRWRMRLDQMLKFQPYFSKRWGDPTEISFEVTIVPRKKKWQGFEVFDISSVAPIPNPDPVPEDVLRRKDIDIMKLLAPRDDNSYTDSLIDGPLGPYLRQIMDEDTEAAPADPPPKGKRAAAAKTPTPAPAPRRAAPPSEPEQEPEQEPEVAQDEEVEPEQEQPSQPPPRRVLRAPAPQTSTPAPSTAPKSAPKAQDTQGMSPLERARALTSQRG